MTTKYEKDYVALVNSVIEKGELRQSRVGPTYQLFGTRLEIDTLRYDLFPLLTQRKIFYGPIFGELAAFLVGACDLQTFKNFGCNYWNDNAAKWPRNTGVSPDRHRVGRIYGAQWRSWEGDTEVPGIDQLSDLVHGLKADPFGRRHLLTTWNPGELHIMCLPPCHVLAQFNVRSTGELDCMVTMRSVDLCLGLPADVALYAALLLVVAQDVDRYPGKLIFSMGDTHVYQAHLPMWEKQQQLEMHKLPRYALFPEASINDFQPAYLQVLGYACNSSLKYELLT